jgi:hypothetical protein
VGADFEDWSAGSLKNWLALAAPRLRSTERLGCVLVIGVGAKENVFSR